MTHDWRDFNINPRGSASKVSCPECERAGRGRNLNLSLNHREGLFNCHHSACGYCGSLEHGVTSEIGDGPRRERGERGGTRDWRRDRSRPRPPVEVVKPTPPPAPDPEDAQREIVRQFFERRGIPFHVALDAGVTWGPERMPQWSKEEPPQQTIQFPYYVNGELVNIKYRGPKHPDTGKKTHKMVYKAEKVFWGLDWCEGADEIVITEGEPDALACRAAGYDAVLSVPNGAVDLDPKTGRKPQQKLDYLQSGEQVLKHAKRVIIATDGDRPGELLAEELSRRIGRGKCLRVHYPEGSKDLNEVLVAHGAEAVLAAIRDAVPYPVDGIFNAAEYTDRLIHIKRHGFEEGWLVGLRDIERIYRPVPGTFTTLTGIPNFGKSTVLDQILFNLAMTYGLRVAEYTPESYPYELHLAYHLSRLYERPYGQLSEAEVTEGSAKLGEHFWSIDPEEPTLEAILDRAETLVFRHGVEAIVIDPFTSILEPDNEQELKFIKRALMAIRSFVRRHHVHAWVVAHPTKMPTIYDRDDPDAKPVPVVPTPYNIAGAAHWNNFSDFICCVHQSGNGPEFHVQKVRQRGLYGNKGTALLRYDQPTNRLLDVGVAA